MLERLQTMRFSRQSLLDSDVPHITSGPPGHCTDRLQVCGWGWVMGVGVCIYICMHKCIYTCVYVDIYVYIFMCVYAYICVHIYIDMCVCTYICTYIQQKKMFCFSRWRHMKFVCCISYVSHMKAQYKQNSMQTFNSAFRTEWRRPIGCLILIGLFRKRVL
jgi:hypothetical protein